MNPSVRSTTLREYYDEDARLANAHAAARFPCRFSGFLPAPLLGCLLVWELGLPPMAFGLNQVHFLSLLGMAAVPSSGVFFSLGRKVRG